MKLTTDRFNRALIGNMYPINLVYAIAYFHHSDSDITDEDFKSKIRNIFLNSPTKRNTFLSKTLNADQLTCIYLRFEHHKTYTHIADVLNVSSTRARDITHKAVKKIYTALIT